MYLQFVYFIIVNIYNFCIEKNSFYHPMKKECPEIVTKNVRVYLEMSGKCLSFDPKNDQIFRPDFFWWFEYPENIRNMWEFFFSIFFNMENVRNTYEFFQFFFQYGNCPEFLYGKCPEYVWNINSGQNLDKTKILDMKNSGKFLVIRSAVVNLIKPIMIDHWSVRRSLCARLEQ